LAWSAFSLFYHGSLLPPAIHPKMSLARYGERAEVLRQGLTNLRVILYDPVSLIVLVAGAVGCLRRGTAAALLALGGLLYLATYVVYGGDWMDARIFTPLLIVLLPFAATTLASATRRHLFVPAVAAGA